MKSKTVFKIGQCYACRKHVEPNSLELYNQNGRQFYVCPDCLEEINERKTG